MPLYRGTEIPVFPFAPEWSAGVRLTQRFQGAVKEAVDTSEERLEFGPRALYGLDFQVATDGAQETAYLKAILDTVAAMPVAMPVWCKKARLTANYTAGGATLNVEDTGNLMLDSFAPFALVWRDFKTWELVEFSAVASGSLTITPAAGNWSAGDYVVPVLFGSLARSGLEHATDEAALFEVEFMETFNGVAVQGDFVAVHITTVNLPGALEGSAYSQNITAANGFPPYTWTIIAGALPDGLSLNAGTGLLSGTPTESGTFTFTVQVQDTAGYTDAEEYELLVDAAIDPTNFSGLVRWYKADTFSLGDGTAIGDVSNPWVDQSASAVDLGQSNSLFRPLFKTNQFNTQPGILFDGINDKLTMASALALASGIGTIIIVYKHTATNDGCLLGHSTLNRQVRSGRSGTNNISRYDGTFDSFSSTFSSAQTAVRAGCWKGGTTSGQFFENKTARGVWSSGSVPTPLDWVGDTSYGQPFSGSIAEIIIYNTTLSDADWFSLYDNYLALRNYGLP